MSGQATFIILNGLSVIVLFACCISVIRQTASDMQKLALLVCVLDTICCIGFFIKSQAIDVGMYLAGQMIAYSVVTHGIFFMFLFVLAYCRFSIPSFVKVICCGLNFIVTFSVLTMNFHPFFYESIQAVPMNGYVVFEKVYGPLHNFTVALFMLYLLASVVVAVVFSIKNYRRKNYIWRIIFAIAIPFATYLVPKMVDSNVDLLSLSGAIFCVIVLYLIYQNKLYDIDNIMTKFSVASLDEAFVVFDNKYRIKGWNAVAVKLFPCVTTLDLDCDIRDYETPFKDFLDGTATELRKDDKIYSVSVRDIGGRSTPEGKVIRTEDVTVQHNYTSLLQENIDRINQDLAMARVIQRAALPDVEHVSSAVPQIDVAAFMKAAKEVGGDFYDCCQLDENKIMFLIADVSGKGIPAALFMMRAKVTIKSFVEKGLAIDEVFNKVNAQLNEGNDKNMFLTAWMGVLDVRTGHLCFVSAGHDKPVVARADGRVELLTSQTGLVLAVLPQTSYAMQELILNPGDGIFLYTDGVTDAQDVDGARFGSERVVGILRSCAKLTVDETLANVRESVDRFVGEAEQFDDITSLMVKYLG